MEKLSSLFHLCHHLVSLLLSFTKSYEIFTYQVFKKYYTFMLHTKLQFEWPTRNIRNPPEHVYYSLKISVTPHTEIWWALLKSIKKINFHDVWHNLLNSTSNKNLISTNNGMFSYPCDRNLSVLSGLNISQSQLFLLFFPPWIFSNTACITILHAGFEITMKNHCDGDIFEHSFRL